MRWKAMKKIDGPAEVSTHIPLQKIAQPPDYNHVMAHCNEMSAGETPALPDSYQDDVLGTW